MVLSNLKGELQYNNHPHSPLMTEIKSHYFLPFVFNIFWEFYSFEQDRLSRFSFLYVWNIVSYGTS